MSTTQDLLACIRRELKDCGMTYADLAKSLDLSESSVKRMFAKGDMPLSRVDEICSILKIDFAQLSREVAQKEVMLQELTCEQESMVVADKIVLLCAICCMSLWSEEQILQEYNLTSAQVTYAFTQLDKIGIIELRPLNRYRLKLAKTFKWVAGGPVMQFFKSHALGDYFNSDFKQDCEMLSLVHGRVTSDQIQSFKQRLASVVADFSRQHINQSKIARDKKTGITMVLAMRQWEFQAFESLRKK